MLRKVDRPLNELAPRTSWTVRALLRGPQPTAEAHSTTPPKRPENGMLLMPPTLDNLLIQLRDGTAPPTERVLEQVRALVREDMRIPPDMMDILFVDPLEAPSDAAGLLGLFGLDDLGPRIAAAIEAELAERLTKEAPRPWTSPARDALVPQDNTNHMAELALTEPDWAPVGAAVEEAVRVSAGRIEIADGVLGRVGLPAGMIPLREAVLAAAGRVDVADAVLAAVGLRHTPVRVPRPANNPRPAAWFRSWMVAGTALAAAAALLLTVERFPADRTTMGDGHRLLPPAMAGEVVIEDLALGAGVQVIEIEGADGSVILWVEEEA